MKVPRRPFGARHGKHADSNPALPPTVPILGLGCSSFSTFFWSQQDQEQHDAAAQSNETEDAPGDAFDRWSRDRLDRDHPVVQEWIETIVMAVSQNGITLLDTAPWYGHGTSEVVLGWGIKELLARHSDIQRSDLAINTKVGRYEADPQKQFDFSYAKTIQSCQTSLQRMQVDYVDVLQLHDPEFAPSLEQLFEETIPAMLHCKRQGWCKALGMTGYPLEVQHQILQKTLEYDWGASQDDLADGGSFDPATVWDQSLTYGHLNLHDRSLLAHRFISGMEASQPAMSFFEYCQKPRNTATAASDRTIRVLAAAPLSMGLLTHSDPPEWHPADTELKHACKRAAQICEEANVDIASLAILFAMSNPSIPCTILGIKDRQQLKIAVDLANRFQVDEGSTSATSQEEVLESVLDEAELRAHQRLNDAVGGPFADVWNKGGIVYQWDGVSCAHAFWKDIEGAELIEWQRRQT